MCIVEKLDPNMHGCYFHIYYLKYCRITAATRKIIKCIFLFVLDLDFILFLLFWCLLSSKSSALEG